jgi:alkanesulfonate monooxygenase
MNIELFTTAPPIYGRTDGPAYLDDVRRIACRADQAGYQGILIYTDNATADPWLVAQDIAAHTRAIMPLVAVQPVYTHPYTVAKMVSTLACLYNRRVALNMVAGGFMNDLAALGDHTPHDRRYDRLVEYTTIIQRLLAGSGPVTFDGEFYSVRQLSLKPALPPELFPLVLLSGSSGAGLAAAHKLNAVPVMYPEPPGEPARQIDAPFGIRVGIMARKDHEQAWKAARERFPADRAGKLTRTLASKTSDSEWHKQLSSLANDKRGTGATYWLEPFEHYKTNCPYFVGSYSEIGAEIGKYVSSGCNLVIMDVPARDEDFEHAAAVFSRVSRKVGA